MRHLLGRFVAALLLALSLSLPAAAVEPDEILADRALEQRARQISGDLRCLVCQNQSIDDSSAPLARDLRLLVRERLKLGDSDAAVRAFVAARYGEFVLLRPPLSSRTLLLWAAPLVLLALAGIVLARGVRASRTGGRPEPVVGLTPDEQARLDQHLKRNA